MGQPHTRGHQNAKFVSRRPKKGRTDTKTAKWCQRQTFNQYLLCYAIHDRNDFWERERECERSFSEKGPFFFITTENLDWILYENREEFIVGTNILAIAAARSGFRIVDDSQMSNHHHVMGAGSFEQANDFANHLHAMERKYQTSLGRRSLKDWDIRIDPVKDLKQFRNQIVYTDRNAYVARRDSMPTGYSWGSANLLFNGNLWLMKDGIPYSKVGGRKKRLICRSHDVDLPVHYSVCEGMILRSSFVDYHTTEQLFNNANQYFTMLTRRGEADIEMAALLGESIQIPHEEAFLIVASWYPGRLIGDLKYEEKLQAAIKMKKQLASSNRQIIQILGLSAADVDRMFPRPE